MITAKAGFVRFGTIPAAIFQKILASNFNYTSQHFLQTI
jgi:hypothetical protein